MCVLEQFQQEPARVLVGGVRGGGAQLRGRIPHVGRGELGEHLLGVRNYLVARRQRCVVPVRSDDSHERKGTTINDTMLFTAARRPKRRTLRPWALRHARWLMDYASWRRGALDLPVGVGKSSNG